jgi:surface protein
MVVSRKKRLSRRRATIRTGKKMVGAGSRMSCLREPSPIHEPMTNDSIRLAVAMWKTDRPQANREYGYIGEWDTSNVTNMSLMFHNASEFNADIGRWDTSNVTHMAGMFKGAAKFNANIGAWNTSNVTNMSHMFDDADRFNADIGRWDTSNVTYMSFMFYKATNFNADIGDWETRNVTNMSNMFMFATNFNQYIGEWDTGKVTNMAAMFKGSTKFNDDISQWDTSKVTDMAAMFKGAAKYNEDIGEWDTSKVTNMNSMFYGAEQFNQDISQWDTRNVENMDNIFEGATNFEEGYGIAMAPPAARASRAAPDVGAAINAPDVGAAIYAPAVRDRVLSRFVDYGERSGVAFEVHNIFRKMNKSKYINRLMTFFRELTTEQRNNNPFIISGSGNLTFDYWDPTKMKSIAQVAFNHYINDKSERKKEAEMSLFNSVFNKLINCAPDKEVKQLTNSSLAYMWSSDWSDDERALYIYKMINDSAEAYDGNNTALNISCIQGIFERFILGIRDMIQIKTDTTPFQTELFSIITNQILEPDKVYELWREEVNTNAKYKNIKKIISKRVNNANIVFDNVDAVALKKSYRDFMKTKYEEIITDKPTLDSKMNENQIKQFIDYVPVHIQDGGRKKKKSKKHNSKKKRGRKNNTKKGRNVS